MAGYEKTCGIAWGTKRVVVVALICFSVTMLACWSSAYAKVNIYEGERLNVDVGFNASSVVLTQRNAWFGEPVANIGNETDTWSEFGAEPAVYLSINRIFGGELFGGLSGVGTQTFGDSADGIAANLNEPGKVTLELAYGGWRRSFGEKVSIELMGGNFDYQIGTGFLVKDGGSDGGERGGFYLGARSAFRRGGLTRLKIGNLLAEGFYVGNNPRRRGVKGHLAGGNLEYDFDGHATIGATFLQVRDVSRSVVGDEIAEKLKTYDFRADVYPIENLALSGEFAFQRGGGRFEGEGWWLQTKYAFPDVIFKPTLAYRYAVTTGDDPNTSDLEGFGFCRKQERKTNKNPSTHLLRRERIEHLGARLLLARLHFHLALLDHRHDFDAA